MCLCVVLFCANNTFKVYFPFLGTKICKTCTNDDDTYNNILEEKTITDKRKHTVVTLFAQVSTFCSVSYNYIYLAKLQLHYMVYLYSYV